LEIVKFHEKKRRVGELKEERKSVKGKGEGEDVREEGYVGVKRKGEGSVEERDNGNARRRRDMLSG